MDRSKYYNNWKGLDESFLSIGDRVRFIYSGHQQSNCEGKIVEAYQSGITLYPKIQFDNGPLSAYYPCYLELLTSFSETKEPSEDIYNDLI